MSKTVHTDSRGRVSLGGILKPDTYYLVTKDENGTVYLDPAIITPLKDLAENS